MTEYIEREAAIDATYALHFKDSIQEALRNLPAADVRPVVQCKDCKWTKTDGMEDYAIYCEKWDRWEMPQDGFCWLGKKRKETTNGN